MNDLGGHPISVGVGLYTFDELKDFVAPPAGVQTVAEQLKVASQPFPVSTKPPVSLLLEAYSTVHEKRTKEYGSFEANMENAACLFNILRPLSRCYLDKADIAWGLLCVKLARESCKHKRDNLLDAVGYLELIDEMFRGEPGSDNKQP